MAEHYLLAVHSEPLEHLFLLAIVNSTSEIVPHDSKQEWRNQMPFANPSISKEFTSRMPLD